MFPSLSPSAPSPEAARASRLALAPRILHLADGDPVFAAQIRGMMWDEYKRAGTPFGASEEGMLVWWDETMGEQSA